MKKFSKFMALYASMCWLRTDTIAVRINQTAIVATKYADTAAHSPAASNTLNDRNRRLIPYATYYVPNNHDHSSNSIQQNSPTLEDDVAGTVAQQHAQRQPATVAKNESPRYVYGDEFHRDSNRYNYIPIAYIPGVHGVRYHHQLDHSHHQHQHAESPYLPQTSLLDTKPIYVDDAKLFATASPTYTSSSSTPPPLTTTPTTRTRTTTAPPLHGDDKKISSFTYFNDYLTQPGNDGSGTDARYFGYVNAPLSSIRQKTAPPQSTYLAATAKTPVLFSTPQTDYLNFRYSETYKTQSSKYDEQSQPPPTTTPPTVEITSPKHYTIGGGSSAFAATAAPFGRQRNNHPLPSSSYSLPYHRYPEMSRFVYSPQLSLPLPLPSPSPPPSPTHTKQQATKSVTASKAAATIELVTQPTTKTLMTIVKSHEIRYPSERPAEYDVPYEQQPYTNVAAATAAAPTEFSVDDVFKSYYNLNKQLPERITPDNLKDSIKTLSYILQILQKADSITQFQKSPHDYADDILETLKDTSSPLLAHEDHKSVSPLQNVDVSYEPYDSKNSIFQDKPLKNDQSTPGRAGIDYPTLSVIPETSFSCKTQRYKGFFADPDTKCQVWHYCDLNGGQASFLCPNGTIFNQAALTCDWWFNVKCASTPQLYVLNERLYKYIIPMRPSFPEDYSGPLVDQYLTEKFKEIETKRKYRYPTNATTVKTDATSNLNMTAFSEYEIPTHLLSENL